MTTLNDLQNSKKEKKMQKQKTASPLDFKKDGMRVGMAHI